MVDEDGSDDDDDDDDDGGGGLLSENEVIVVIKVQFSWKVSLMIVMMMMLVVVLMMTRDTFALAVLLTDDADDNWDVYDLYVDCQIIFMNKVVIMLLLSSFLSLHLSR